MQVGSRFGVISLVYSLILGTQWTMGVQLYEFNPFGLHLHFFPLFDTLPERIYNFHYGNGVPTMFISQCCPAER